MGYGGLIAMISAGYPHPPDDDDDDDRNRRRPPRLPKPEPPAARPPGADIVRDLIKDVKSEVPETEESMQP